MFVHLHCHSHYSFLRGVASPEEIIAAALEQKMPAVALTDTNGMYAAVPFYKKAQDAGIKPIVGVALGVAIDNRKDEILRCAQNDKQKQRDITMVLLAMDMDGYSNLCQLVTLRHLGTTKLACPDTLEQNATAAETDGRPVTLQELAEHHRGVIALCPLPSLVQEASNRRGTIHRPLHESRVTSH